MPRDGGGVAILSTCQGLGGRGGEVMPNTEELKGYPRQVTKINICMSSGCCMGEAVRDELLYAWLGGCHPGKHAVGLPLQGCGTGRYLESLFVSKG